LTTVLYNKRTCIEDTPMSDSIREKLKNFYLPFNALLSAELGMKFPEWK